MVSMGNDRDRGCLFLNFALIILYTPFASLIYNIEKFINKFSYFKTW